ncbi:MAG: T9SS type A sorting domain-containing protein [Gemmatimonadota bacterium]|nr:MAG: T9SS type A sorting domain-containing protein [Gemmatimonadota bacterium]
MKRIVFVIAVLVAFSMSIQVVDGATKDEIQGAINNGLAWLAAKQETTPGPDFGSWGIDQKVGKTGLAVKKFEHHATLMGYESPLDPNYPYHELVQRGLNYLFLNASTHAIVPQPAGDPDSDGDGIGVGFSGGETYETGIALMAIVESNTPDSVVDVPDSPVDGWTYYDVAVDVVDFLAFGQIDAGIWRGSWGYTDNSLNGDNSNSGYATLGLRFAESSPPHGFGLTVPQFVKDELGDPGLWIDYIQNDVDGDQFDGGSAYFQPNDTTAGYQTVNILETGNLLSEMEWYGDDVATQRVLDAIDYIVRHWADPGNTWPGPQGWHGNYQAMFTLMKGLEAFGIEEIGGFDWFDEVSDSIVVSQHANGSWGPDIWDGWVGGDSVLSTTWALLTLQKVFPPLLVHVDIKPTSCPNPFNNTDKGKLPVAILGNENFDVTIVDPATIKLEGVPPLRWSIEDVAAPYEGELCSCSTQGPDGFDDLTLKYNTQEIVAVLGEIEDGEELVLTLTGATFKGRLIEGSDCVVIRLKGRAKTVASSPSSYALFQNYPNPFNPETEIGYVIPIEGEVRVEVFNLLGQKVATLVNEHQVKGTYTVRWNATDAPSGVYFFRIIANEFTSTKRMVLMK